MSFEKELQSESRSALWEKYCGFLSLSMKDYMQIQYRLLREQIDVYKQCPLGKKLLKGTEPITVENFRDVVPFTTYEDYAPYLIPKDESILPGKPTVWLETTWESGCRPSKVAPYTASMLEVYRSNLIAAMMLSTSNGPGDFNVRSGDRVLYTLAPMPYATGLFPLLISSEIKLHFMPSLEEARHLSFAEQNKIGLKQAISGGMDQFFGMSGVIYSITKKFSTLAASGGFRLRDLTGMSPVRLFQLLRSQYLCRRDGRELRPADIFNLRGFVCVGTDSALFKDDLELAWGKRPLEIHGGTEQACIGTETWSKDGLVFYPDTCFYEFIPEAEMYRSIEDPNYIPRAYLMDEISANQNYELVVTVLKGGAFMRYRIGDMYRCLRTSNARDNLALPQFEYIDRVPTIIDIAGFTRFSERSIESIIAMSRLEFGGWFAAKEYSGEKCSYLHLYVEPKNEAEGNSVVSVKALRDHLSAYFNCYDRDYEDLRKFLGVEPLQITVLPVGAITRYEEKYRRHIRKINPLPQDITDMLRLCGIRQEGVVI